MLQPISPLDAKKISEGLGAFRSLLRNPYGAPKNFTEALQHPLEGLELLPKVDSTNTYLYEIYRKHPDLRYYAVLAEQQTAGRGRFNRSWISTPGNLYLSLLTYFSKGISSVSDLYIKTGHAVIQALEACGFQGAYLKHPNDIFYDKKKLGGILIEIFGPVNGDCRAIIGVGINIYAPTEAEAIQIQQPWTAIELVQSQPSIERNLLAGSVLKHLLAITVSQTLKD